MKVDERSVHNEESEDLGEINGSSFYVEPYVNIDVADVKGTLKVMYLQNNEKFWSEMASSPVYRGGAVVLNANALYGGDAGNLIDQFGMASLENMYFAVYNSNPLQAGNLMTSTTSTNALIDEDESPNMYARLYNNYKNAHFYRNGYNADVLKSRELSDVQNTLFLIDPANDMGLPMGVATPDRKGFNVNFDLTWKDALEFNGVFSMINTGASMTGEVDANGMPVTKENNVMRYAAGLGVDVGRLVGLDRKIKLQGSYDHSQENAYCKRKSDRIMSGVNVDVYGPVAFLAGYQMSTREFGQPLYGIISKAQESLLLVGPRVKIAPNSYLSVQYGLLTDKLTYNSVETVSVQAVGLDGIPQVDAEGLPVMVDVANPVAKTLSIDKNIISADVTVNF